MRMASLPNDIKNDTRKLQIIGSYIKHIILCAINSSLKKVENRMCPVMK
jgi:hypothetical protein